MKTQVAIDKPAAGAPGTKFIQSIFTGFYNSGILGQAEVIVAGYGYDIAAPNSNVGTIHGLNFAEIGINAEVFGLVGSFIPVAFRQNTLALIG